MYLEADRRWHAAWYEHLDHMLHAILKKLGTDDRDAAEVARLAAILKSATDALEADVKANQPT